MLISFLLAALVLLAATLYFLLRPLNRDPVDSTTLKADDIAAVYREKLLSLQRQLEEDEIDDEQFKLASQELELALAHDLPATEDQVLSGFSYSGLKWILAAILPVAAILLYLSFGTPSALSPEAYSEIPAHASTEDMTAALEDRLQKNPDDLQGWLLLARSYSALKEPVKANHAYIKASELAPGNPYIMLDLAESYAQINNNLLAGRPEQLIEQALEIEPDLIRGKMLKGVILFQQDRFSEANAIWISLYSDTRLNESDRQLLASMITAAGGTIPKLEQSGVAAITVSVKLDKTLRNSVQADDILFVYARAESGPPMPLAIKRYRVQDLPLTVTLDDSDSMMDEMKISVHEKVVVLARISKSGTPMPQSGDFQAMSTAVNPKGNPTLDLTIDTIVP